MKVLKKRGEKPDKVITKEMLLEKVRKFLSKRKRYCSATVISKGVKVDPKLLTKHGIKITEVNEEAGLLTKTAKARANPRRKRRRGKREHPSKFQGRVHKVLTSMFGIVQTEVKFRGLVGVTGCPLRVDFFIPEWNLVVEADGIQHVDPNHKWAKRKGGRLKLYDEIKNEYFKERNILMCRIPYCPRVIHDEVKALIVKTISI